jgi:YspA, cpYpsA-related SLOG family
MTDTETAGAYRVLVTGSRDWDAEEILRQAMIAAAFRGPGERDLTVVHGACPTGADAMADAWAEDYGFPAERHLADWTGYGKSAGFIRNAEMVTLGADLCLAFYKQGAGNKGTDHCASLAEKAGIPVRRVMS